jgi:hypothetical protein
LKSGNGTEKSQRLPSARYVITNEQGLVSRVSNEGSQKNTKLAFEESVKVITSLYEGGWRDKQEVVVDVLHLTTEVSSVVRLSIGRRL